jgi:hypothetical protein
MSGAPAQSKKARICMARGCGVSVRGTDLGRHYRARTDFLKIASVMNLPMDEKNKELQAMDSHTFYMFSNGYHSPGNLPHWSTHKPASRPIPEIFKKKQVDANENTDSVEEEPPEKSRNVELEELPEEVAKPADEDDDEENNVNKEAVEVESSEEADDASDVETKTELTDQINAALRKHGGLTDEVIEKLSEQIAHKAASKTIEMLKAEKEKIDAENVEVKETWSEGDTMMICRPCTRYSAKDDVPLKLSRKRRGNFGMIEKKGADGKPRLKRDILRAVKEHSVNELHTYCCIREKDEEDNEADFEKENKAAGRVTIRNIIKTLKRGGSSVDFQADNNLFHLESNYQDIVVATKNDSSESFFKVRDVVFDVVSEKVKAWFSARGPGEVEEVSVTLDKVTVQRTSYTVLLTYFFRDGVIYILLNKLMVMKVDEYDSEGTARAVVDSLVSTLGISRARLADILLHFAYDGVYATTGENIHANRPSELTILHRKTISSEKLSILDIVSHFSMYDRNLMSL